MRYFEDIVIGTRRELGTYTFTAERIKAFASKYDPQPFHLDEEAGRKSLFGGLAASGWHTAAAWMRTAIDSGSRRSGAAKADAAKADAAKADAAKPDDDAMVGGPSPGFKNLKWPKPVLAGDTITFFTEVKSKRASVTRPQWGLIFVLNTGENQRGELVFSFDGSAFVARRPAGKQDA
jgi:acyl dehydratase